LSSFLIIDNLIRLYQSLPESDVYAGAMGSFLYKKNKYKFVSGAGFWLTPDNVEFIVRNFNRLDVNIIDDVAIGILMDTKKKIQLNRFDIIDNNKYPCSIELLNHI
jgi:hypothetical protein